MPTRWCDTRLSGTRGIARSPNPSYITFVPERHTMFDELWSEIQDMPGEIFDIPELNDEDFNLNEYLAADYDY
jgi:hypothetical protein